MTKFGTTRLLHDFRRLGTLCPSHKYYFFHTVMVYACIYVLILQIERQQAHSSPFVLLCFTEGKVIWLCNNVRVSKGREFKFLSELLFLMQFCSELLFTEQGHIVAIHERCHRSTLWGCSCQIYATGFGLTALVNQGKLGWCLLSGQSLEPLALGQTENRKGNQPHPFQHLQLQLKLQIPLMLN